MHRHERQVDADEREPEVPVADLLAQHPAGDLREVVVDAARQAHHRAGDEHVVEVRDDEVRVGLLQVGRRRRVHHARDAADREQRDERDRELHRDREAEVAAPHREDPVEDLHAGRDRDQHRRHGEHRVGDRTHADGEHVVRPHAEAEEGDQDARVHHDRVAEERLARERRQDLRHQTERRQDQDVDLWVTEDPEQVLPEERVGAGGHRVEVRAEEPVELQEHERDRDAPGRRAPAGTARRTPST